jgi:hypothetical protein
MLHHHQLMFYSKKLIFFSNNYNIIISVNNIIEMVCFPFLCSAKKGDVALEDVVPDKSIVSEKLTIVIEEESIVVEEARIDDDKSCADDVQINEPAEPEGCNWYGTISAEYSEGKEYYTLHHDKDSIIYFGRFPLEWATSHAAGSGPSQCEMCYINGMHSDVFLGYCAECAGEVYGGKRGRGFIASGKESRLKESNENRIILSAFDTYLSGVDLDLVGKEYIWYGINVEKEYMYDYDDSELLID